jgi:hypothetical protein
MLLCRLRGAKPLFIRERVIPALKGCDDQNPGVSVAREGLVYGLGIGRGGDGSSLLLHAI